ncbi:hypothetical protein [Silvimonas amylolytica]|uniref:Transferrin-binding protein B C-lobe/N-lobe beta barrel domain-containing protein n=1 Tax=Silvimonas amylolytica TaxID=449663 RepID=A0ABQ2PIH6_9NEIS|nr:hypothetical protein [Silvimonas amylolytica]GGP25035.1 hypothetical protein GCM10010971_08540 [Silvimonas amylolytica]
MQSKKQTALMTLAPLASLLLLAACGGGGGGDSSTTSAPTPTPTPAPQTRAAGGLGIAEVNMGGSGSNPYGYVYGSLGSGASSNVSLDANNNISVIGSLPGSSTQYYKWTSPVALGNTSGISAGKINLTVASQNKSFWIIDSNTLKSVQHVYWTNIDDDQIQGQALVGLFDANWTTLGLPATGTTTYSGHAIETIISRNYDAGYAVIGHDRAVYVVDATATLDNATGAVTVSFGNNPVVLTASTSAPAPTASQLSSQVVLTSTGSSGSTTGLSLGSGTWQGSGYGGFYGGTGDEFAGLVFGQLPVASVTAAGWYPVQNLISFAFKKQ